MEVVDNTNKLSPAEGRLNLVNLLLARSFGKKVSAHWGMEDELIKLNHLELIARVRWFGMYQVLGRFQGENGRHIQIHEKYLPNAIEYARLFEQKTGEKVLVEAVRDILV